MKQFPIMVALVSFVLRKDLTQSTEITVPKHEFPLLRKAHGENNVLTHNGDGVATYKNAGRLFAIASPLAELDRLRSKYGQELVEKVYSDVDDLSTALMKNAVEPELSVPSIDEPVEPRAYEVVDEGEPNTVDELKIAIQQMGGEVASGARKPELLAQYAALKAAAESQE